MSFTVLPSPNLSLPFSPFGKALKKQLETIGRLPHITVKILPVGGTPFELAYFSEYNFSSNVLIPVDAFSFVFVAPQDKDPINKIIKDGDMVRIYGNGIALATGIIDSTSVEVDSNFGERVHFAGRTLLGQLEDQSAVNSNALPIYSQSFTLDQVVDTLKVDTRLPGLVTRGATTKPYLFATQPGESKLTALLRYLEPLNLLVWNDEFGRIVIGKPRMNGASEERWFLLKEQRSSNVLDIKVTRASTTIPNQITPVWSGQEGVEKRLSPESQMPNAAKRPAELFAGGHILRKTIVVSTPQGASPQDLAAVNMLQKTGASNLLQAYAKREIARANQHEIIAQVVVPGHFNEKGKPFVTDTMARIQFDRGDLDEEMYCFQVDYTGGEQTGQKTSMMFCRKGSIVADIPQDKPTDNVRSF